MDFFQLVNMVGMDRDVFIDVIVTMEQLVTLGLVFVIVV